MYYSAIGLLAILILLIENRDIVLKRNDTFPQPVWQVYRQFLFAVLAYYTTDCLWGVLETLKFAKLLFADTSVYYIAMALGVFYWTQYTVTYLEEEESRFGGNSHLCWTGNRGRGGHLRVFQPLSTGAVLGGRGLCVSSLRRKILLSGLPDSHAVSRGRLLRFLFPAAA